MVSALTSGYTSSSVKRTHDSAALSTSNGLIFKHARHSHPKQTSKSTRDSEPRSTASTSTSMGPPQNAGSVTSPNTILAPSENANEIIAAGSTSLELPSSSPVALTNTSTAGRPIVDRQPLLPSYKKPKTRNSAYRHNRKHKNKELGPLDDENGTLGQGTLILPSNSLALLSGGRSGEPMPMDFARSTKTSASPISSSFMNFLPGPLQNLASVFWKSLARISLQTTEVAGMTLGVDNSAGVSLDTNDVIMKGEDDEVVDLLLAERVARLDHQDSPFGPLHDASKCPHPLRCAQRRYIPDGSFMERKEWLESRAEKKMTDVEALWWMERDGRC